MGKLRAIWGSDHKVGTTMLSQSCAEILGEKDKEVLLLTVSTNPGDDFYDENTSNISALKSRLSCRLITKENLRDYALKGKKIYKINGFQSPKDVYEFTLQMAADLIEASREAFDEVVVDCGTDLYNPLTLASLTFGKNNLFIFTQQESALRHWELLSETMSQLKVVPKVAVINKYFKGDNYTLSYIAQRTGIPQNIFRTVEENEFGMQAEADRKTLLFYGGKQYEKDIRNLI